jgi:hypothetical protein
MKTVLFTNWTSEDFTYTFGGEEFSFKAGSSSYLQDYLAEHFAKHLANRELHKKDDPKFHTYVNNPKNPVFMEFFNKSFGEVSVPQSELKAEVEVAEKNAIGSDLPKFCDQCASKGVRHLKTCPTLIKSSEEEFEGLN